MAKQFYGNKTNANGNYNKFGNKKAIVDGITFDSQHEANYYGVLKLRLRAGEIESFEMQKKFPFVINGDLVCIYKADFVVKHKHGYVEVIDTKSEFSRKDPVYRIKYKLMKAIYGITIKEVT